MWWLMEEMVGLWWMGRMVDDVEEDNAEGRQ